MTSRSALVLSNRPRLGERLFREPLQEIGYGFESSVYLGAGIDLAAADLSGFDICVALMAATEFTESVPEVSETGDTDIELRRYPRSYPFSVELGVVAGKGLPIFLVVEEPLEVPPEFTTVRVLQISLDQVKIVSMHLKLFVHQLETNFEYRFPRVDARHDDEQARLAAVGEARLTLQESRERNLRSGVEFSRQVFRLLNKCGAHVLQDIVDEEGFEFDGVISVPGAEHALGKLMLVDVKLRPPDRVSVERFVGVLLHRRPFSGLLIYDDSLGSGPKRRPSIANPLLLLFGYSELLAALQRNSLAGILLQQRNHIVHGGVEWE